MADDAAAGASTDATWALTVNTIRAAAILTVLNVEMRQLMMVTIYFGGGVGAVDASCASQSTA